MPRVQLGDGCELVFVAVETSVHFTNYKPRFMLDILAREPVDGVLYFDPDIVVICRWQFFQDWLRGGVALCQDVNGDMPASHPTRNAWRELLMPFGFRLERDVERYLNGGFVGVHRQDAGFLRTWQAILESLPQLGCDLSMGGVEYGSGPFTIFDQDALNATAMAWTGALSLVGPDGMGFQWGGGGYIMQHAVGPQKPWRKHFWCDALVARRPSRADRLFFENVRGPVRPYGRVELAIKRWDLALGAVIGRYLG